MTDYQPHPLRIQRKRIKGWRLPHGATCVTRPGRFGNCFEIAEKFDEVLMAILSDRRNVELVDVSLSQFAHMNRIARDIEQLRGFKLACWCPLDRFCHADSLARFANR